MSKSLMYFDVLSDMDPDLVDLFPDYLSKRIAEVDQVDQFAKSGQWKEIEVIGHKMSGNAALFGLERLAEWGKRLEGAAVSSDLNQVLQLALEMKSYLTQVQIQLQDAQGST